MLKAGEGEDPGLAQFGDGAHLGDGGRGVGGRAEEARRVGGVPERSVHQRAVDAERRMVRVNGQVDPEIRLQKQRRGEEALAVLVLGGVRRDAFGLLLGEDRVEALGERRVVKPDRIVEAAGLEDVDGIAGEGGAAGDERGQVAGHPEAQGVEADEEDIPVLKAAAAEGGDDGLDEGERGGEAGAGVGVDLEPGLAFGARGEAAAAGLLVGGDQALDLGLVGGLVEPGERGFPHGLGGAGGRGRGGGAGRQHTGETEQEDERKAHGGEDGRRDEKWPRRRRGEAHGPRNLTVGGPG